MECDLVRNFRNVGVLPNTSVDVCLSKGAVEEGALPFSPLRETTEKEILAAIPLDLIANFSFIPASQDKIKRALSPYGINAEEFCIRFDGATFEFYPKQLKATVFIYVDCYNFEFTKPQWLGAPLSKNTEKMLLGKT